MIKNSLAAIADVSIFPVISLVIFVGFFVALSVMMFKVDKSYIKHMEELPLKED